MAGFWESLGQGLETAGGVMSPDVYDQNQQARRQRFALMQQQQQNLPYILNQYQQLQQRQQQGQADARFRQIITGMSPDALRDPSALAKSIPPDILASSPAAQNFVDTVGKYNKTRYEERDVPLRGDMIQKQFRNGPSEPWQNIGEPTHKFAKQVVPPSQQSAQRDFQAEYANLDPAGQTALDMQAWNYINKNTLPYRKGTGGGADRNDPIIHRAGAIAVDLGMSPQELSAKSAEFKSNAQTLYNQTKKLNAIQGTLESFHNNIATWDSIAEGEAPKLGGEKLSQIRDKLKKIDFSDVKTLNDWEIKVRTQFNDPAMVAYTTAAMTVAMDYARILSSQGQSAAAVTEGARNEALKLVAAGYNRDARKALIGTLESDAAGQVKGLETQTNRLRGKLGLRAEASTSDPEKATSKPDDVKSQVESAGWTYEPDKYEYRVNGGKVQRRAKGG